MDTPEPLPTITITVDGERLVATLPGTSFATTFHRVDGTVVQSPATQRDRRADTSRKAFETLAWDVANRKARELGWIA